MEGTPAGDLTQVVDVLVRAVRGAYWEHVFVECDLSGSLYKCYVVLHVVGVVLLVNDDS